MALSPLDPKSALVIIDLQKGILARPTVHPAQGVLANAVRLARAFRARRLPVVRVQVGWSPDGGDAVRTRTQQPPPAPPSTADFWDYAEELSDAGDLIVRKRQWGAFYGTDLDLQLRRRGVTQIVLCGIATSIGVESTARAAWEHNYQLTVVSDAVTDMSAEAHDRALRIIFPRLGEIGTTDEVLALLKG